MTEKLRVLFISGELIAGDLAYRLKQEGCDVKLYQGIKIEQISFWKNFGDIKKYKGKYGFLNHQHESYSLIIN